MQRNQLQSSTLIAIGSALLSFSFIGILLLFGFGFFEAVTLAILGTLAVSGFVKLLIRRSRHFPKR